MARVLEANDDAGRHRLALLFRPDILKISLDGEGAGQRLVRERG
jgi:hypothetical protein